MRDHGFDGVARADAKILILGSMPSQVSLAQQQYYAHPRNAFWPIMARLLDFDVSLSYEQRLAKLMDAGIALWDVVQSCHRPGSLDADIRGVKANDFAVFFDSYPAIDGICFNGRKAESLFRQYVMKRLVLRSDIYQCCLPSTSPAYAGLSFEEKLAAWKNGVLLNEKS